MKSIRFLSGSAPYNAGDQAGFPPEAAEAYVKAGVAVYAAVPEASAVVTKDASAPAQPEASAAKAEGAPEGKAEPSKQDGEQSESKKPQRR